MSEIPLVHERRLLRMVAGYVPLAVTAAWLSFHYGVGAKADGDPARDRVLRGTGLAPPLFLPAGAGRRRAVEPATGAGAVFMLTGLAAIGSGLLIGRRGARR